MSSESPRIRGVLEQAQQQVSFFPNMYARMVNSPGLLETYLTGYDRFRKESGFTPAEQEENLSARTLWAATQSNGNRSPG